MTQWPSTSFLWLYAQSRSVGWITLALVGIFAAASGWMWAVDDNARFHLYGAAIPGMAVGLLTGMAPTTPFGELDVARPKTVRAADWLALAVLTLIVVALGLLTLTIWPSPNMAGLLIRNALGTTGLTLAGLRLLGPYLAWVPGLVLGGAAAVASGPDGVFPAWAWQMQHGGNTSAWIWASVFLIAGLAVITATRPSFRSRPA